MGSFELISPAKNMLMGLGVTVWWLAMEHSGILTSSVWAISQLLFMAPEQQFGAASPEDPIEACC